MIASDSLCDSMRQIMLEVCQKSDRKKVKSQKSG